jgi:hypothetical protein
MLQFQRGVCGLNPDQFRIVKFSRDGRDQSRTSEAGNPGTSTRPTSTCPAQG